MTNPPKSSRREQQIRRERDWAQRFRRAPRMWVNGVMPTPFGSVDAEELSYTDDFSAYAVARLLDRIF